MGRTARRTRSPNELLGLLSLPLLLVGAGTGLAIWALAARDALTSVGLIIVHAYAGLLSVPLVAAKIVAGVTAWRRRSRSPRARPTPVHGLLSGGLVVATVTLYASGTMMYANVTPGGNAVYKQVHLWAAVVTAALVTQHLAHYLRRSSTVISRAGTQAGPAEVLATRRYLLRVGAVGLVTWGGLRSAGQLLASAAAADPNDFPVTLTAGGADQPDPETWRLHITGDVARPLQLSLDDLKQRPMQRHTYSLDCVIGWSVVREWGGVPVHPLVEQAQPTGPILSVIFRSTTGYQVNLGPDVLEAPGTMVTWEVEGVPLTPEHGYPGRLMAPDVVGERCVKWLSEVEVVCAA